MISAHELSAPLHVDIVRRDHAQAASYFVIIMLLENLCRLSRDTSPWLFWPTCLTGVAAAIVMISRLRQKLGTQALRVESGAQVALIGSDHGFSRFETPKWKEDGNAIVVYGTGVSWRLKPKAGDEEALRRLVQMVLGQAPTPSRGSTPVRRASLVTLLGVIAIAGGMVTASRPPELLFVTLFAFGFFLVAVLVLLWLYWN